MPRVRLEQTTYRLLAVALPDELTGHRKCLGVTYGNRTRDSGVTSHGFTTKLMSHLNILRKLGAPDEDRTRLILIDSQVFSPENYRGIDFLVVDTGIEPVTSAV